MSDRVLYLGPEITEDAPPAVREGLARRRLVTTTGACPCGAHPTWPSRQQRRAAQRAGTALRVLVSHEDECPATNENLARAWRGAS
jgi:hypothetical protein